MSEKFKGLSKEEIYQKTRQELIQESNQAFNRGNFTLSHHIDRVLKIGAQVWKENQEKETKSQ